MRRYTVQAGETLASIALRELGEEAGWLRLFAWNRDVLNEEVRREEPLMPGTVLRLP